MLFVSLRDLQWRRRRFLIGVFAAGLVFALAVVLTGISASFVNEVSRTINAFHADEWVVSTKATGPFTSTTLLPDIVLAAAAAQPGVERRRRCSSPRFTVKGAPSAIRRSSVVVPGSAAVPKVAAGRAIAT